MKVEKLVKLSNKITGELVECFKEMSLNDVDILIVIQLISEYFRSIRYQDLINNYNKIDGIK